MENSTYQITDLFYLSVLLEGMHKTMSFKVGIVDNTNQGNDATTTNTLYVLADGQVVGAYQLSGSMPVTEFTTNIANCQQLTFWIASGNNSPRYGFFDIIVE